MGMDVYGKNPSSAAGEYFRNNVWSWHPLATYIENHHPDLAAGCEDWHSNSGYGLGPIHSVELAAALKADIASGKAAAYAARHDAELAALPRLKCDLCDGTGIRCDAVGVKMGQPDKVIDEPGHPRHGQTGWCNGCTGHGTREDFKASYWFSVENLSEFADFLADCGGFEIN